MSSLDVSVRLALIGVIASAGPEDFDVRYYLIAAIVGMSGALAWLVKFILSTMATKADFERLERTIRRSRKERDEDKD